MIESADPIVDSSHQVETLFDYATNDCEWVPRYIDLAPLATFEI
jgi:hypothetical protein